MTPALADPCAGCQGVVVPSDRNGEPTYPVRLRGLSIPLARGLPYAAGPWNVLVETRVIGAGAGDFTRARDRILTWTMHRSAGLRVQVDGPVECGVTPELSFGVGPIWIRAKCEVVEVVDTDVEAGFAYGTLAGHPECGEEAFLVRRLDNDLVLGSVAAFSRPAWWVAALLAPLATRSQTIAARRYLSAMSGR